ncbi:MAG: hypothetical protein NT079_05470 [Candidatus Omnitrophica bacterium]|nr:hypothetical protein [Candidatus Omnitrophota bacterium]
MQKYSKTYLSIAVIAFLFLFTQNCLAGGLEKNPLPAGSEKKSAPVNPSEKIIFSAPTKHFLSFAMIRPYIEQFRQTALTAENSAFPGLSRSFQLSLDQQTDAIKTIINDGGVSYDQSILSRLSLLAYNDTTILDTYEFYGSGEKLGTAIGTPQEILNPSNPLVNCTGTYWGEVDSVDIINHGLYRIVRLLDRNPDSSQWTGTWEFMVDTGAVACFIVDALEAYHITSNEKYKKFAILLGEYILKLQAPNGGIRYGPRHIMVDDPNTPPVNEQEVYWWTMGTEQNQRCWYALDALATVDQNSTIPGHNWAAGRDGIKNWFKSGMYNFAEHRFYPSAGWNGTAWVPDWVPHTPGELSGVIATDVAAFAPLEMMVSDPYFTNGGTTTNEQEIWEMFHAAEQNLGFLNGQNKPIFFRFSDNAHQVGRPPSNDKSFGSVEWSSQMALAYLKAAHLYADMGPQYQSTAQDYLDRYNTLIASLETFFETVSPILPGTISPKVAPYASYYDSIVLPTHANGTVAWGVGTGTGTAETTDCRAALAAAYFAFAKIGYDPIKLGGGLGIPIFPPGPGPSPGADPTAVPDDAR